MTNALKVVESSGERAMSPVSPTTSTNSESTTIVAASTPFEPRSPTCGCCLFRGATNPAKDPTRPLHGWPKIAKLIADHSDFEAFQSFKDLNIKSLLYYQAELEMLRKDLHKAEWEDFRTGSFAHADELGERADLLLACKDNDYKSYIATDQMKIMCRMRVVLKEYNEALLQYSQITALPSADTINVNSLRSWLADNEIDIISGPGAETWGDVTEDSPNVSILKQTWLLFRNLVYAPKPKKNAVHLIVPRPAHNVDGLTRWVANEFVPWWDNVKRAFRERPHRTTEDEETASAEKEKKSSKSKRRNCNLFPSKARRESATAQSASDPHSEGSSEEAGDQENVKPTLNTYTEARMLRFTSSVATVIACLLPTVAIAVLATRHTTAELLGLIAVFTAIFAIGLMFLTDASTSRVEIFTATAAFSAVMVVFVQNQDSDKNNVVSVVFNGTKIG